MSEWALQDDPALVGRRIRQARRELGLTQGDLATRIGVSLGALDRFETGKGDPSDKLEQIAEITGKPVSWYTSTDQQDVGDGVFDTGLPAELRRRLAESSRRRGSLNGGLATEEGPAPVEAAGEAAEPLVEEPDALAERNAPDTAMAVEPEHAALLDERTELVQQHEALRAALAAEQREHATRAAAMAEELERVNARHQELSGVLEQSSAELASSRAREAELAERAVELERRLETARAQLSETTSRLDQAETDLERLRQDRGAQTEDVDLRTAELGARAEALDAREAAMRATQDDLDFRSTQLDAREAELRFRSAQLDTREAELGIRSAHLDTREADLGFRSAQLDTREATLADAELRSAESGPRAEPGPARDEEQEPRESDGATLAGAADEPATTTGGAEGTRVADEDAAAVGEDAPAAEEDALTAEEVVHLAVLPDRGYKLVARYGAAPEPGAIVELDDVRYRCLRVQPSPFLGDDRQCAVLELLRREPDASHSTDTPAE
jgi:transcriptional regulator with XRE-family HTH domain